MITTAKPLWVGACAVYPYSKELAKKATFTSRYDEEVQMFSIKGDKIHLPREACPKAMQNLRVLGLPVEYNPMALGARNDEQVRLYQESLQLLLDGTSHIIQAPTGIGKTFLGMWLAHTLGLKVLVVVTKQDIMSQWKEAAIKFLGLDPSEIGTMQQDVCSVKGKKVVIGMVHSLAKDRYPSSVKREFGLVIFDEVHRMGATGFGVVCGLYPSVLRLGLSATPQRTDGKDLLFRSHIGEVMVVGKTLPMVPRVLVQPTSYKLPRIRKLVKDKYTGKDKWVLVPMPLNAGKTMHVNKLIGRDVVRNSIICRFVKAAYGKGRRTIIFSDLRKGHLEDKLYPMLRSVGIPAKDIAYYVGGMKESEREKAKGAPVILATYKMCSEATDIPWLDTCVLGTPRSDVVQVAGRILREYEGKQEPVILDLVDTDAELFLQYHRKRLRWYRSIGAEVIKKVA